MGGLVTAAAFVLSTLAILLSVAAIASAPGRKEQKALEAAELERDELKETLVAILDGDGNVRGQLRLPGEIPPPAKKPNRTPCGSLCAHAWFDAKWKTADVHGGLFRCEAGGGRITSLARPNFLDDEGQCVMFERKKKS